MDDDNDLDQGPPSGLDMLAAQIAELQQQSAGVASSVNSFIEASRSEIDGLRSDFQNAVTGLETRMTTIALPSGEGGDTARVLASRLDVLISMQERDRRERLEEQKKAKEQAEAARQAEMQRRLEELAAANGTLIAENAQLQEQIAQQRNAEPGANGDKVGNDNGAKSGNGNGDKAGAKADNGNGKPRDKSASDPDAAVSEQPSPPVRRHRFL
jgi:uncharacterized protein with von Willebrand factor type A (vWA) domain